MDFSCGVTPAIEGVIGRELGADEPADDSKEKTSFCGLRAVLSWGVTEPSFWGGGVGFVGADEFQRSAKESDMARVVIIRRPSYELCWPNQGLASEILGSLQANEMAEIAQSWE